MVLQLKDKGQSEQVDPGWLCDDAFKLRMSAALLLIVVNSMTMESNMTAIDCLDIGTTLLFVCTARCRASAALLYFYISWFIEALAAPTAPENKPTISIPAGLYLLD